MSNRPGWGSLVQRKNCQIFRSARWINLCSGKYPDYLISRWRGKLTERNTAYTVFKMKDAKDLLVVFDKESINKCDNIYWNGIHEYTCTMGKTETNGKTYNSLLACLPFTYGLANDLIEHCKGSLSNGLGLGSILGIFGAGVNSESHTFLYWNEGQSRLQTIAYFNLREEEKNDLKDISTDGSKIIGFDGLLPILLVLFTIFFLLRHIPREILTCLYAYLVFRLVLMVHFLCA